VAAKPALNKLMGEHNETYNDALLRLFGIG